MTIHTLLPDTDTLHGDFSPDRAPVLRIKSGDSIEAKTLDAGWGVEAPNLQGTQRQRHPAFDMQIMRGHAMLGPVWIDGAQAGMTLKITFDEIVPGDFGFTYSGGFDHRVHRNLGFVEDDELLTLWTLDAETMMGTNQHGQQIRLKPFLGNIGMPPPEAGNHSTAPPYSWGGNLDCKDLVAGTQLYLPVPVAGGLLSLGDGHALQGHGEVSVTAIECPMERVKITVDLLDDMPLNTPRAWTPEGWLTFGFDEDMEKATMQALDEMVSFMVTDFALESRQQALGLATALVDLHITQIANPRFGVHAFLPHDGLINAQS